MSTRTPLRRELLLSIGLLFSGAMLIAALGLAFLLPKIRSPGEGVLFVIAVVVVDLTMLFVVGGTLLRRVLFSPMEHLAADTRRIGDGDYDHRVPAMERLELEHMRVSVNAMADRLIAGRELLAENVASLDRTNEELIVARDQVIHAARLASVGTLAAGIAHEVGNPLGAIIAFVDVARSRTVRDGGDTELLDSIRGEAKRIDRIVRGLLDYARPGETEARAAAPAGVLHRVRELMENQGKLDAVDVIWQIEEEVPHVVMDPHRLEQVMVNLLLNALDALHTTVGPRLTVRLSVEQGEVARLPIRRADDPPGINYMHRRRISRDDGGIGVDPLFTARHVVVIDVEDNGPGIQEEALETVFDPFYTTKEPGKGTGLGLSICARLVEGMGGRIQARAALGGGAFFTIRLPGASEPSPAADEEAPQPMGSRRETK